VEEAVEILRPRGTRGEAEPATATTTAPELSLHGGGYAKQRRND